MTPLPEPAIELISRVDDRVDLPAELLFDGGKGVRHFRKFGSPYHQHVDIARSRCGPTGQRTEQHRRVDPIGQRNERGPENIHGSDRLCENVTEILEYRVRSVRLVEDLSTPPGADQQTSLRQPHHLALDRARAGAGHPHQLAQVQTVVRVAVQQRQKLPAELSEQSRSKWVGLGECTHYENKCTQSEYKCKIHRK